MSRIVFARKITRNQLEDYVQCFKDEDTFIIWVDLYTSIYCLQFIVEHKPKDVYFVQIGPFDELASKFKNLNIAMHIINTEQMSRLTFENPAKKPVLENDDSENDEDVVEEVPFPFQDYILRYLQGPNPMCETIIDYSAVNLAIMQSNVSSLVRKKLKCFFTPHINQKECEKKKDVIFVGDASSVYRASVLRRLKNVTILEKTFGTKRDHVLFSHKILVNIHYGPSYTIFEELRCLPCILNKTIVVSETSMLDPLHPICNFIIFAKYDKLAQTVNEVLENYDAFYNKLFIVQKAKFDSLQTDIQIYQETVNKRFCD